MSTDCVRVLVLFWPGTGDYETRIEEQGKLTEMLANSIDNTQQQISRWLCSLTVQGQQFLMSMHVFSAPDVSKLAHLQQNDRRCEALACSGCADLTLLL